MPTQQCIYYDSTGRQGRVYAVDCGQKSRLECINDKRMQHPDQALPRAVGQTVKTGDVYVVASTVCQVQFFSTIFTCFFADAHIPYGI